MVDVATTERPTATPARGGPPRPASVTARISLRSMRTSALVVVLGIVGLILTSLVGVTESAAIQSLDLASLVDNPAIRALYGNAYDLGTAGGFVTWRYGQTLCVIICLWAALTATRLLRGDEENGRTDLLLAGSATLPLVIRVNLLLLAGVSGVLTLGLVGAFLVSGEPVAGSLLFSLGYGLAMLTFAAVGAVTSQLFSQRRRAAGIAGAALAAAYVARMVGDASPDASWVTWLTPFGWLERLQPFAADDPLPLVPLVLAPLLLSAVALVLAGRRDLGEGLIRDPGTATANPRGLASPLGYAWRERVGGVVGWGVGLAVFGLVTGAITNAFTDFIATSASFAELAETFGMASLSTAAGFVATMDSFAAIVLAGYTITSVHTAWDDESNGRLDLVFAAPVTRVRWLLATIAATAAAVGVLTLVLVVTTWAGVAVGGTSLSLVDAFIGAANVLPLVLLFFGIAVAAHGLRPSITTALATGVLVASYVLSFLGPALKWPNWVLDLSAFRHVSVAPAAPVAWTATVVLSAIGVVAIAIGLLGYARRDLTS